MPDMQFLESLRTHIPEAEIVFRLSLALVLSAIIGLDRELRDRPAGLRTHMLTALAAAMFTVLTLELFAEFNARDADANPDPMRIIEAVTAGVAFLAAGAIIQARGEVRGLTTGAAMWLAGAIGLACGGGFYSIAIISVILSVIVLTILKRVEVWTTKANQQASPGEGKSDSGDSS